MDLKKLMFLKAATGGGNKNLLDYSDLVNKNYSGNANTHNVRPEHLIAVKSGSTINMTFMAVNETNVRFYDEDKTYQSSHTISQYNVSEVEFTVPDGMHYILPKWYQTDEVLPVETFVANNPVIKYV